MAISPWLDTSCAWWRVWYNTWKLREIGKHLNCVLELYKVCSHFVFLHIFHSVFSFLCFASTMKMPFRTDRCLESTSVYSGVSLSLNTLRSSTNHISLYFLYKYRNSWLTFIKRNACFSISRLYTQIMSNVYKKVISIWNTWFVFIKNKGILIIFETLSAIEEIFFKAPFFGGSYASFPCWPAFVKSFIYCIHL